MKPTEHDASDSWVFPRIWATFLLGLIGCSYRLWISPTELPAVPLLGIATVVPDWISGMLTGLLVISTAAIVIVPSRSRWLWWIVAAMLGGLFLLDQHRLQPWAYQSCIYALIFATMQPATARGWILPLAASVYIYSALGKFDYQFVHTVGIEFLETAGKPFGGLPDNLDLDTASYLAHLFPITELLAGLFLFPRRTRPIAGIALMVLHGSLIGLLGPWGLDHSAGVLLWNLLLMVQAWMLFVGPARAVTRDSEDREEQLFPLPPRHADRSWAGMIACIVVLFALVMPIFERTGYWDHWLSWAVRTSQQSRRSRNPSQWNRAAARRGGRVCGGRSGRRRMAHIVSRSLVIGLVGRANLSTSPLPTWFGRGPVTAERARPGNSCAATKRV